MIPFGNHTLPENLNVGEVMQEFESYDQALSNYFFIVIECDYDPHESKQYSYVTCYNGQLFPNTLYLFRYDLSGSTNPFQNIIYFMRDIQQKATIESIKNMFVIPSALIRERDLINVEMTDYSYYRLAYTYSAETYTYTLNKQYTFSDYTPKNNKCFVYPYNYLLVTNNNGNQNIYKYEDFYNTQVTFQINLSMQLGCSGKLLPLNYKKQTVNMDEALPLGKYPTFAWSSDAYTNWLTQNAVNISTSILMTAGTSISNPDTAPSSIASTSANLIGAFYGASIAPNLQGGSNTGDVVFSSNLNSFYFRGMRAKTEYMRVIDDYFSRFGYKTNLTKQPNLSGRLNFNYIEIAESENIGFGQLEGRFMEEINNICRRGTTIWHNYDNMGNFDVDNPIV